MEKLNEIEKRLKEVEVMCKFLNDAHYQNIQSMVDFRFTIGKLITFIKQQGKHSIDFFDKTFKETESDYTRKI